VVGGTGDQLDVDIGRFKVLAAVSPPNPDPMMTTLCRSDIVAAGWVIENSLDGSPWRITYSVQRVR
jgi:hypothetical protein